MSAPGEASSLGWNLRRGFRRLSFVIWIFGAGLILALGSEPLFRPATKVCTAEQDPVYPECLTDEARDAAASHLGKRLLARIEGTWEEIDTSLPTRRFQTERYASALRSFAAWQGVWALAVFGLQYLLLWVASGFRSGD